MIDLGLIITAILSLVLNDEKDKAKALKLHKIFAWILISFVIMIVLYGFIYGFLLL